METPRIGMMIDIAGGRVHLHADAGSDPTLLLLHGCGSLGQEILPAIRRAMPERRLIAVDRPGYGYSEPLPAGLEGPDGQAEWLLRLMDRLALTSAVIVAHSLAAGAALCLAARRPDRVDGLLLISPYCRPTDHPATPWIRLTVHPVLGGFIRNGVIPLLAPLVGPGMLREALQPDPIPGYLSDFPFRHAGRPRAVNAMALELLGLRRCIEAASSRFGAIRTRTVVLHGTADRIADPNWHLPWLVDHMPSADIRLLAGAGHALHHTRLEAIRAAIDGLGAPGRSGSRQ